MKMKESYSDHHNAKDQDLEWPCNGITILCENTLEI